MKDRSVSVTVRFTAADTARVDALVEWANGRTGPAELLPKATRSSVVRAAVLDGLAEVERRFGRIGETEPRRGSST